MRCGLDVTKGMQEALQRLLHPLVVGVSLLLLSLPAHAAELLWEYHPTAGYVDASPGVADLDGDGVLDLVLCTTAGEVVALDANGREKWTAKLGQAISTPATVVRFSDDRNHVVVLTNTGSVQCLDGKTGRLLWTYALPRGIVWGTTAVAAADLDDDGKQELIAGDKSGRLVCLDERGRAVWAVQLESGLSTAPAVGDLDGDGQPEILVGTAHSTLVRISSDGKTVRSLAEGTPVGSSPLLCDLNGDHRAEILVGEAKGLSCYNSKGRQLWHYSTPKTVHDAVTVADLDQDGKPEILVVDLQGQLSCLDEAGKPKWTASVEQRVRRSPSVADVDRDGQLEVLVAGYSSALHVFDADGNLKERFALKGSSNATPTVVDFRADGNLTVVVPNMAGVVALKWRPRTNLARPLVLWSEYRVNSARTGSLLGQKASRRPRIAQVDYGLLHAGSNTFAVTVQNPERANLTLELEIQREGQSPLVRRVTSSDSTFAGELGYTIVGDAAEDLSFRASLRRGKRLLARRERRFHLVPFAKDVTDVASLLAQTQTWLEQIPDATLPRQELALLEAKLAELREKAQTASTMSPLDRGALREALSALFAQARRLEALASEAAKHRSALVAYRANPWAPFGGAEEIAEGRTAPPEVQVEAFFGEVESAALNLANYASTAAWVRIEPQDLLREADSARVSWREVLTLLEAVDVPTQSLDMSTDALPRVNQANAIFIPAWNVRQLWLNVSTAALKPGLWRTRIRLRSVAVKPAEAWATLTVRVWPHSLPRQQPLRLCQWGYVHTSVLKDFPEAALQDQIEHGTNVFVATADFAPDAQFDANGDLVGHLNFTEHDGYVRKHAPHGIILFFNYQHKLKGPAEHFTPTWRKAYKAWIRRWVQHLKEMGLNYADFAFYPIDEPGLREGSVDAFLNYARPIREVDPKIQIYVDPVRGATLADLQRMAPNVDIWCPNRSAYLLKDGLDKLHFIKSTGKAVWTYECDGNAKHQSPLGYYRGQAWLVWYRGLTGIGFWSYCTSRFDPWFVPEGGSDYLLIYQGDGVVTSKRWEAVRDGVEDYSMLWRLRQAVQQAKNAPEKARFVQAAERFLTANVFDVAQFCGLDAYGTQPTAKGMAFQRQIEDQRWHTVRNTRRRLAELLDALTR